MKLITRQTEANELVARFEEWEKQQAKFIESLRGRGLGRPVEELKKLGLNPDPDACDAVIRKQIHMHYWASGNIPTWTSVPACNECGESKDAVVRVGEEPDYESSTAFVCRDCLSEALGLVGFPVPPNHDAVPLGSGAAPAKQEPVAWMVQNDDGERWLCHNHPAAAKYGLRCVPLFAKPQPTLTDAEREANEIERLQRSATDWRLEADVHRKRAAAAVAEIARLRLTDEEREAIEFAIVGRLELADSATLRNLLERMR